MPEKRTEEEVIKPMAVTVIGTGDGRLQNTVAATPDPHMPNLVVQVVTPVVAVLVRAANMFFVTLTGLAGTTATGFTALDFKQMIITALITAGLGSLKDIATIFAGLQRKFPLASGSICLLLALSVGCAAAPPALTPESRVAWQATRVIKGLDLVRDTAIDAHRHGLMATETTRKVVLWHQGSLRVIQAAGTTLSWRPAVQVSLQELQAALPPEDRARLSIYFTLIQSLLNEAQALHGLPGGDIARARDDLMRGSPSSEIGWATIMVPLTSGACGIEWRDEDPAKSVCIGRVK